MEDELEAQERVNRAIGTPVLLDPKTHPCQCVITHRPKPRRTHRHHILPLAWGGSDQAENIVAVCPTGHANIHIHHERWTREGRMLPKDRYDNDYLYDLAAQGWVAKGGD